MAEKKTKESVAENLNKQQPGTISLAQYAGGTEENFFSRKTTIA